MIVNILLILLLIAVALVLLVVAAWYFLRWYLAWRLRTALGGLGDALEQLADALPAMEPGIERSEEELFDGDEAVAKEARALRAKGFTNAGQYTVRTLPGVAMLGLVHEPERIGAAIMRVPEAGVCIDLVSAYADGNWITCSTAPETGLDRPPGMPIVRFEGIGAGELLEQFLAGRPRGELRPVSAEGLQSLMEEYSRAEAGWRASQGMLPEGALDKALQQDGVVGSRADAMKQLAQTLMTANACTRTSEWIAGEIVRQGLVQADEWEQVKERAVYVYEGMPAMFALDPVWPQMADDGDGVDGDGEDAFDDEAEAMVQRLGARGAFAELNGRLPEEARLQRLASLEGRVKADVYLKRNEE